MSSNPEHGPGGGFWRPGAGRASGAEHRAAGGAAAAETTREVLRQASPQPQNAARLQSAAQAAEPSEKDVDPALRLFTTALRSRLTLAVAESLTGGRVVAAITGVPGSSAVLRGSVTAYATDLKAKLLGVDPALLDRVGAVDGEVARQMALGVRRLCGADVGIATTGVAGPSEQDGRPVGTVFVAVVGPDPDSAVVTPARFPGDRSEVQAAAAHLALTSAVAHLTSWAAG